MKATKEVVDRDEDSGVKSRSQDPAGDPHENGDKNKGQFRHPYQDENKISFDKQMYLPSFMDRSTYYFQKYYGDVRT